MAAVLLCKVSTKNEVGRGIGYDVYKATNLVHFMVFGY